MMKKISAMAMAAAMAVTMVAGTAISTSAADVTNTNVYTVESVSASSVTTIGKAIAWNYGDETNFDSALLNHIPAMKNPEAFAFFNIK